MKAIPLLIYLVVWLSSGILAAPEAPKPLSGYKPKEGCNCQAVLIPVDVKLCSNCPECPELPIKLNEVNVYVLQCAGVKVSECKDCGRRPPTPGVNADTNTHSEEGQDDAPMLLSEENHESYQAPPINQGDSTASDETFLKTGGLKTKYPPTTKPTPPPYWPPTTTKPTRPPYVHPTPPPYRPPTTTKPTRPPYVPTTTKPCTKKCKYVLVPGQLNPDQCSCGKSSLLKKPLDAMILQCMGVDDCKDNPGSYTK